MNGVIAERDEEPKISEVARAPWIEFRKLSRCMAIFPVVFVYSGQSAVDKSKLSDYEDRFNVFEKVLSLFGVAD